MIRRKSSNYFSSNSNSDTYNCNYREFTSILKEYLSRCIDMSLTLFLNFIIHHFYHVIICSCFHFIFLLFVFTLQSSSLYLFSILLHLICKERETGGVDWGCKRVVTEEQLACSIRELLSLLVIAPGTGILERTQSSRTYCGM